MTADRGGCWDGGATQSSKISNSGGRVKNKTGESKGRWKERVGEDGKRLMGHVREYEGSSGWQDKKWNKGEPVHGVRNGEPLCLLVFWACMRRDREARGGEREKDGNLRDISEGKKNIKFSSPESCREMKANARVAFKNRHYRLPVRYRKEVCLARVDERTVPPPQLAVLLYSDSCQPFLWRTRAFIVSKHVT